MHSQSSPDSSSTNRKVLGWVLLLPLLVSLVKLPFWLAITLNLMAIAASVYGFWFALRHAGKGLAVFAGTITLLNIAALIALSTPSALKGLYYLARIY